MLERVGLFALLLCVSVRSVIHDGKPSTVHEPALAMHCGKKTQHRDVNTGEWISGEQDCLNDEEEILNYCKKVYPALTITNVLEENEAVHVPSWCRVGSHPPCKGHGHNVRPYKCVAGGYESKALAVKEGCYFQHKMDYDACYSSQHWESEAAEYCRSKNKTMSSHQMLNPCQDVVDKWKGVQFLCCTPPDVPKPKASKTKFVPAAILGPSTMNKQSDVNPICLQPKMLGACRALLPAWHYNRDSHECEFFHYGGCGGNDNNFESREECVKTCTGRAGNIVDSTTQESSSCGLKPVPGPCMAYFPRFYYDPIDGVCKSFVYGGCNGNGNNFMSKESCAAKCKGYKKPLPDPVEVDLEPPVDLPSLSVGPVMLDGDMKPVQDKESPTTTAAATATTPFYTNETTIENEHDVFTKKLDEIKSNHQDRVNAILSQWDSSNAQISSQDKERVKQLEKDLQDTISSLEDEYDGKMAALNDFHMERMDRMLETERGKALQKFLDQLNADKPKLRHILNALEKYIAVERQDKTHIMEHYAMAMRDDFEKGSVPDFHTRIDTIEERVNNTRTVLSSYPDILRRIQDEVEDILATMPDSPDFEYDKSELYDPSDDDVEEEIITVPDTEQAEIDDGGIPDPDICTLPPVVGNCRASIPTYYFDSVAGHCKIFYYGGCGGNENNFALLDECQTACPGKSAAEDTCSLPKVVGYCRAAFNRFYYDSDAGYCKSFIYGGCGGNSNNYATLEECNLACLGSAAVSENLDAEGVLGVDNDVWPIEDKFDINDYDDANTTETDDTTEPFIEEDGEYEDETNLDPEVDRHFTYYGDRIPDDSELTDPPQPLISYKQASAASNSIVWIGLGAGLLFLAVVVVAVVAIKRNQTSRPPMKIVVDKPPEDSEKELSPEEKQLLALQQNGYENPTFKFFEKRQMA